MIDPKLVIRGADSLALAMKAMAAAADARATRIVTEYGFILKTTIQAKASGRPGPNAPTGDYRRSWTVVMGRLGGDIAANVGTNKPQGRRLEYGFTGVDSIGRHYDQPPYPHVNIAADEVAPKFHRALAGVAVL